jgi:hypothetical protein
MDGRDERRRHRRYVTKNTEYHLRDDVCVGVRHRGSGEWHSEHMALGRVLAGGILRVGHGFAPAKEPGEGASLWFDAGGMDIVTSTVDRVDRPQKPDVTYYIN